MEPTNTATNHPFRPHTLLTTDMATSQLDEGYSDGTDTRSQPDSDMAFAGDGDPSKGDLELQSILQAATSLGDDTRKRLILLLISSLDNKSKLEVNRYIKDLTHFDPALYLPAELVLNVFSYLNPKDLLTASRVSRSWRARSHDNELWRACFAREGWEIDKARAAEFERELAAKKAPTERRSQGKDGVIAPSLQRRESRKRTRVEAFSDGETSCSGAEDTDSAGDEDVGVLQGSAADAMEGVENTTAPPQAHVWLQGEADDPIINRVPRLLAPGEMVPPTTTYENYQRRYSFDSTSHPSINAPLSPADIELAPIVTAHNSNKLNWRYLYKHRYRLEENWDNGKYKTFTLPHPDYPDEGHTQCIYTIQHSANILVSGSRDKTIRIWDLETRRMLREPLVGHEASVLCLQFDERPEQDIIVSGGSDAMVVIWRFSTGEIIKMMRGAHQESVLNLRFDDRYIVTCSKDKKIKIWNRHALERSETSTVIPAMVVKDFLDPAQGNGGHDLLIQPFTLLATLENHHAAVNAVMIHENIIVSASGDRTTKAWNVHTGAVVKNYVGHTKGIACVQYDGRRIISGSSDQSVRIYDADRQVEVACLQGHGHLVRTLQARFGDLDIVTAEELHEQARQADQNWNQAVSNGMVPAGVSRSARRNAGSSRPEDMLAVGAKLPPGGGGSKWAKIVSGSYDETLIIWRRDRNGKWMVRQQLHLGQFLRQTRVRRSPAVPMPVAQLPALQAAPAAQGGQQGNAQITTTTTTAHTAAQHGLAAAQNANHVHQQQLHAQNVQPTATALAMGAQNNTAIGQLPNPVTNATAINQAGQALATQHLANQQANQHAAHGNPAPLPAAVPAGPNPHAQAHNRLQGDSMRVFKLQFDPRRIICCSQNKVIVGWDFADGEKALELVGSLSLETA